MDKMTKYPHVGGGGNVKRKSSPPTQVVWNSVNAGLFDNDRQAHSATLARTHAPGQQRSLRPSSSGPQWCKQGLEQAVPGCHAGNLYCSSLRGNWMCSVTHSVSQNQCVRERCSYSASWGQWKASMYTQSIITGLRLRPEVWSAPVQLRLVAIQDHNWSN